MYKIAGQFLVEHDVLEIDPRSSPVQSQDYLEFFYYGGIWLVNKRDFIRFHQPLWLTFFHLTLWWMMICSVLCCAIQCRAFQRGADHFCAALFNAVPFNTFLFNAVLFNAALLCCTVSFANYLSYFVTENPQLYLIFLQSLNLCLSSLPIPVSLILSPAYSIYFSHDIASNKQLYRTA